MTLEVKRLLTMGFLSWIRLYHLAMADLVVACHMFLERFFDEHVSILEVTSS